MIVHSQGQQIEIFQDYNLSASYFEHPNDLLTAVNHLSESLKPLESL